MRACIFALLLSTLASAAEIPEITNPVTDQAKILTSEKIESLSKQLEEHNTKSGVQLAVLTIDTTDGEPIETYSLNAATKWGGGDKRRDDGGLFVLAIKDRRMRIELGYGLEGRVTDLQAQQLLDAAKPYLRDNDPDGAVQRVMDGLMELTVEGTMSAEERARLDAVARAAEHTIPPQMYGLFSYLAMLLVFGIIGRVAKSRLVADDPPSKTQVWIILGLLILAVEIGFGVAGITWVAGWAALCGTIAGLTFFLSQGILTFQWPLFMLVGSMFPTFFLDDPVAAAGMRGLVHLFSTLFLANFDSFSQISSGTSFDSSGASSGSSRRSRDDDDESPGLFSSTRSSSRSSWGSSSSSSSSSRSSRSSSSSGSYKGGGGSFGGGGASSSW